MQKLGSQAFKALLKIGDRNFVSGLSSEMVTVAMRIKKKLVLKYYRRETIFLVTTFVIWV